MPRRVTLVVIAAVLAVAATFVWLPTRFALVTTVQRYGGSTVIHTPDDLYPAIEYLWAWDGQLYASVVDIGGQPLDVPAWRTVAWLLVVAEQVAILLAAMGAIVFLVRRARRRATTDTVSA